MGLHLLPLLASDSLSWHSLQQSNLCRFTVSMPWTLQKKVPQLENSWKSGSRVAWENRGWEVFLPSFLFRGKNICWLKVGGPLKELDIGFRKICIFHSVFPLSADSGNRKVCVSAKAGVILLVLGPGDPGATDSKHQDASPYVSPRKVTKLPLLQA